MIAIFAHNAEGTSSLSARSQKRGETDSGDDAGLDLGDDMYKSEMEQEIDASNALETRWRVAPPGSAI